MSTVELLGWFGNVGFILGAIYLTKSRRVGWLWQVYGNGIYTLYALAKDSYSLLFLDLVLLIVNVIGWLKWKGMEQNDSKRRHF